MFAPLSPAWIRNAGRLEIPSWRMSSSESLRSPDSAEIASPKMRVGKYCSTRSAGASNGSRANWYRSLTSLLAEVYGWPRALRAIGGAPLASRSS